MPPARATERARARKRKTLSFAALASILLMAMVETPGCVIVPTPPVPQTPAPISGQDEIKFQAQKMLAALVDRDRRLASVQSPAVMEYTAGDQHLKAKEEIVAKRPDKLRVEAMSPFGVALLLASQGSDLTILEPGKNRFMRGQANADTLYKYVRIPMAPTDAVGLLIGLAPPAFELGNSPDSVSKEGAMLVATFGNTASGTHQLGFSDGNLAMVRETGADGRVSYEVRYSDYHDIGGVMFPYVVDATFPAAGSHVTFRYLRPIVNGVIPDSTFVLTPAPGATIMNLSLYHASTFSNES
jgi:outer membrane lipoprotein-sorting protein